MAKVVTQKPLILASGSSARRALLTQMGIEFTIIPADIDEEALRQSIANKPLPDQSVELAKAKAQAVSKLHPDAYIIGGDQICAFGDEILCKPGTVENAQAQLRKLSGSTHHQYSGVALYKAGECLWSHVAEATLKVRNLTEEEITCYVALDQPLGACGAYRFESLGKHLFSEIDGTGDVIEGLPVLALMAALRDHNIYSMVA